MNREREKLSIAERATEWLRKLEDASAEERAEFWKWLLESPEHIPAVLAAQAFDVVVAACLREHPMDIARSSSGDQCSANDRARRRNQG